MAVYKFRIIYEDHEDVSRDIEIKPFHSFEDLHLAIQDSIKFDASKAASFYISDDYWRKGQEIPVDLKKSKLVDFIEDPHQKFIYIFDPSASWCFNIELFKIQPDENGVQYPRCVKSVGKAPLQYLPVNNILPDESEQDNDTTHEKEIDDAVFYGEAGELEEKGFSEVQEDATDSKDPEGNYAADEEEDEMSPEDFDENAGLEEEY